MRLTIQQQELRGQKIRNNPKAEEIKADNEIRMEWNRAVDCAIVSGISETEILELKKAEIADRVKQSVEQNGKSRRCSGILLLIFYVNNSSL